MTHISEVIRHHLKRRNLTQRQLSIYAGIDYNTLNKIVTGATENPTIAIVCKIWRFFGLKLDGLMEHYAPLQTTTSTATLLKPITIREAIKTINSMKTRLKEKYGTAECGYVTNEDGYALVDTEEGKRWVKENNGKLIGYPASE